MTTQTCFIGQLYRAHGAQLLAYLTQMLGSAEAAREVAREASEKMQRTYQPERVMFPRTMLFKVATNFALMRLRRQRTEGRGIAPVTGLEEVEEVQDHRVRPDRQAMADEIGQHLATAIKELRPPLRAVFVMAHVQGKSRREIASALGVSEKRVDKRMTRALMACRERLASRGIDLAELN